MKITMEGSPKELADFILELQKLQDEEPDVISDMTEEDMDKFII